MKIKQHILPFLIGQWFNLGVRFAPKIIARQAFDTFCRVRKGRILHAPPEFLSQALDKRLHVLNHEIQCFRWPNNGPKVLLLHGWESNTHRWKQLVPILLDEGYDLYAFDAPGHGLSTGNFLNGEQYAMVINEILEKYKPSIAIGHSLGGMALIYGQFLKNSPYLRHIVTLGAPSDFIHFMTAYQKIVGFNNKVWNALENHFFERFGYEFDGFSTAKFVKNIPQKGLLIHDKSDKQVHYKESIKVKETWPHSHLVLTEGYGHSLQSATVFKEVLLFLKGK